MFGAKSEGNQWDSSVGVSLKLSAGVLFLQQAADDGGALSVGPASDRGANPPQSTKITVLFKAQPIRQEVSCFMGWGGWC